MNKYDLYEDEAGTVYEKKIDGYYWPGFNFIQFTLEAGTHLNPLVTPIMESYRDQPFCFGEYIEVRDDEKDPWSKVNFLYLDNRSMSPYFVYGPDGFHHFDNARKIEKITIDGEQLTKLQAEEKRDELVRQLEELNEVIGHE